MFCSNCGKKREGDNNFCTECGTSLIDGTESDANPTQGKVNVPFRKKRAVKFNKIALGIVAVLIVGGAGIFKGMEIVINYLGEKNQVEDNKLHDENEDIIYLFKKAKMAFLNEDYEQSSALYQEIIQNDLENVDAYMGLLNSLTYLNLKDDVLTLMGYMEENLILDESQYQVFVQIRENLNKKDISVVEEEINQYISKFLSSIGGVLEIPTFSSLDELSVGYMSAIAISQLAEECNFQKYLYSMDEVEGKIQQLFGSSYQFNRDNFTFDAQLGVYWNPEEEQFGLMEMGFEDQLMGKVLNVEEIDGGYEAEIIYFIINSYDMYYDEREYPLILQNNKVVGHVETNLSGENEYVFYDSIEELTVYRKQFQYESDEQLIWTDCESINEFIPTSDFTGELAVQYVYDYFDVTEETVWIDIRTDVPYDDGRFKYHCFRWNNILPEGGEAGGSGGPTLWVSNYGQIYLESTDIYGPGDYYLPHNPEIKFSIKEEGIVPYSMIN